MNATKYRCETCNERKAELRLLPPIYSSNPTEPICKTCFDIVMAWRVQRNKMIGNNYDAFDGPFPYPIHIWESLEKVIQEWTQI